MNLRLQDFPVLEQLGFRMPEVGIDDDDLAEFLDSISSPRFFTLTLDVSARERRCVESGGAQNQLFFEEMKALDQPLSRLAARAFERTGRSFTLVLLANNPTAIVGSLTEFQKVGNTWKGERVVGAGGRDFYWSFAAGKDYKGSIPDDSVLSTIGA